MSSHTPTTVSALLGNFTMERIKQVEDIGLRMTLEKTHAMISGIAASLLEKGPHATALHDGNVTLDDARGLADDANHLLDEIDDRNKKQAAANAAVAAVHVTQNEIDQHLSSLSFTLRGKLGPKSPALKDFGVLPLATGGRRAKAAAISGVAQPKAGGTTT